MFTTLLFLQSADDYHMKKTSFISGQDYLSYWKILVIIILGLSVTLRFINLDQKAYWDDEAFTGLRVSDALKLNKSKINFETNLIEIITQKTQLKVTIPITHIVKPYLEKLVNGQAHSISAQKLNNYYKELGKVCKIDSEVSIVTFSPKRKETILKKYELISNHCFRRTFATISLELGLQPSIIMKITGHKTLSSFEEYIGFTTKNAVDRINDVWNNLKM